MNSTADEGIRRALLAVPVWVLKDSSTGLCGTLARIIFDQGHTARHPYPEEITLRLGEHISKWPRFSGESMYPVPACGWLTKVPEYAYSIAQRNGTLWDKSTAYGKLRWELLDFLIECFSELNK